MVVNCELVSLQASVAAGDFAATAEKLLIRHGKKIVGKQLEISYYLNHLVFNDYVGPLADAHEIVISILT